MMTQKIGKPRSGLAGRLVTVRSLLRHFARRQRYVLIPLLLVLILGSLLLLVSEGIGFVAPFRLHAILGSSHGGRRLACSCASDHWPKLVEGFRMLALIGRRRCTNTNGADL